MQTRQLTKLDELEILVKEYAEYVQWLKAREVAQAVYGPDVTKLAVGGYEENSDFDSGVYFVASEMRGYDANEQEMPYDVTTPWCQECLAFNPAEEGNEDEGDPQDIINNYVDDELLDTLPQEDRVWDFNQPPPLSFPALYIPA